MRRDLILDIGGAVFNVKAYGAKGDGSTNDCTAITNADTARESVGGQLYFPSGKYIMGSSCRLTLAASGSVQGAGSCAGTLTNCSVILSSSDTTGTLFNVTANDFIFHHIGIVNTATATAGAPILSNGSNVNQRVNCDNCFISGFYVGIDEENGTSWYVVNSDIINTVSCGLKIANVASEDNGDWGVSNDVIWASSGIGAICMYGSAGGRVTGNKIGSTGTADGFHMDNTGLTGITGELTFTGNDVFVNGTGIPVNIANGNSYTEMSFTGNNVNTVSGAEAFNIANTGVVYIGGGAILAGNGKPAIAASGGGSVFILPFAKNPGVTNTNTCTTGSVCTDYSGLNYGFLSLAASQGALRIGSTTAPSSSYGTAVIAASGGSGIQIGAASGGGGLILGDGGSELVFQGYSGVVGSETYTTFARGSSSGGFGVGAGASVGAEPFVVTPAGLATSTLYATKTNCSSAAAPAVCAAAPAGSVVVAAAATTVVVDTTAVTANSQILVQEDSSLGTRLSVTCNTTPATAPPTVSARTAGTSFTITTTAPTTNPRCFSYTVLN